MRNGINHILETSPLYFYLGMVFFSIVCGFLLVYGFWLIWWTYNKKHYEKKAIDTLIDYSEKIAIRVDVLKFPNKTIIRFSENEIVIHKLILSVGQTRSLENKLSKPLK